MATVEAKQILVESQTTNILLVEDDSAHAGLIRHAFKQKAPKTRLSVVQTIGEAKAWLAQSIPDLLIADLRLPDGHARELLAHGEELPFPAIVITARGSEDEVVKALKAGALDYVVKSATTLADMPRIAERTLDQWKNLVDRKQAEEALRKSEERFDLAVRGTNDGLWDWPDLSKDEEWWSPRWYELLGYEDGEVPASITNFRAFLHPDDLPAVEDAVRAHLQEHVPFDTEYRLRTKSGAYRWFRGRGQVVWNEDGKAVRMSGSIQDIHEHKQADEALRESEKRYRNLFDNAPFGITLTTLDGELLEASPALAEMLGYESPEELISLADKLGVQETLYPHPPVREELIERASVYGQWQATETQLRRKDQEPIDVKLLYRRVKSKDGSIDLLEGFTEDITKRKRAEQELAQAKEEAEAANQAKSRFLANVSHELRTPMTAVMGFADLLLSRDLPLAERREHVQTIHRNAQNLLILVNDILDLSKIEADKIELDYQDCSPWEIVEEVQSLMKIRAMEKNLALAVDYLFPLPKTIHTAPVRLRQILINLVGNALKFTERGGVRITVRCVRPKDMPPRMQFAISDTGIGMAPEEMAQLFQPFTQADGSTTRRFGGTGLGLSISRRLAELLDGEITVQSEPDQGSTFTLTIDPGYLEDGSMLSSLPDSSSEENYPAEANPPPSLKGRILLAEDGQDVQRLVGTILRGADLEVDLADNGQVACEKVVVSLAQGEPYDLILMDIQMPVMDGLKATRRLRRAGWKGPVVALTAHAAPTNRQECLAAGCDDYLTKPITSRAFLKTVARHLGQQLPSNALDRPDSPTTKSPGLMDSPFISHEEKAELLAQFVAELPRRMTRMKEASTTGDLATLQHSAHQLKGSAAVYGLTEVSETARRIEQQADEKADPETLRATLDELLQRCQEQLA